MLVEDRAVWTAWLEKLEKAAGASIGSWDALLAALDKRHTSFHERGCRASDHGLEVIDAFPFTDEVAASLFARLRGGEALDPDGARIFRSALLHRLALLDHARGWVQQFHVGALRNNNTRMKLRLGPDTGFDSIGDFEQARKVARFLDRLDATDQLAKTILYNLNPADNAVMATMVQAVGWAQVHGNGIIMTANCPITEIVHRSGVWPANPVLSPLLVDRGHGVAQCEPVGPGRVAQAGCGGYFPGFRAAGLRREDLSAVATPGKAGGRARLVCESVQRWLNR